jgi:hypothetical protein
MGIVRPSITPEAVQTKVREVEKIDFERYLHSLQAKNGDQNPKPRKKRVKDTKFIDSVCERLH